MADIKIPYGKGHLIAAIPDSKLEGVLESKSHHYHPEAGERELVQQALENPIGSARLRDLAKDKSKIVIIASDHTRPVPSKIMAPVMLAEIRAGNPHADITFLIATGFHRLTTKEELISKFGEEIVANEKIVVHNAFDPDIMVNIGKLPSGGDIVINKLAVEADLLISEGFIEPHFFAGFSGGRKSVLPGVVSKVTVLANHNSRFIVHENARTGILEGNPIHIDMLYAAKTAKLAFIVNVIIDADKKIIKAYAGDVEQAHLAGTGFAGELARVSAKPADIVITSNGGYPLDQNIYQAVKGMTAAEASCKPGGVIIICAACNDGHGGEAFYRWFTEAKDAQAVMDKIMAIEPENTIADQWEAQILARVLLKHTVIMVSDECDPKLITDMKMKVAKTLPEAIALAEHIAGADARYTVIPDGVSVIVR
ncbi:nickel-dependent lactate racemase|uniref:Nickel-dependent lactate racemase n=1 Tax=Dendrosporobacter quercicolus TaxID=146817 RepID=A0A1G9UTZ4_9FIRM|nr:nickel-dependent lactate racemase [Dendrosporobacter quercicolus]NSL48029.1 nickel-dependent lactate racemase [Dendrosporobacter quercicolus DSM 1736]SDM63358.1 Nickel-dependent lactate racemase [Dendrosporobacter quercicolus]